MDNRKRQQGKGVRFTMKITNCSQNYHESGHRNPFEEATWLSQVVFGGGEPS